MKRTKQQQGLSAKISRYKMKGECIMTNKTTNKKRLLTLVITIIMLCMTTMTAMAAADIRSITIRVRSTGDLSYPEITSGSSKYSVTTVEWNKKEEELKAGEKITATVTVEPEEERRILLENGKRSITISGSGELYKYRREGENLVLQIDYRVRGDAEEPEDVWWSEDNAGVARCSEVSYAKEYRFTLYKNKTKIAEKTTKKNKYDFARELADNYYDRNNKDFYFKVRVLLDTGDKSDYVESEYFDDWTDLYYYCKDEKIPINYNKNDSNWNDNYNTPSCGPSYGSTSGPSSSGRYGWQLEKGTWYFYNNDGSKRTGWTDVGGYWYYLSPSTGAMHKGWLQTSDGNWYYLNPSQSDIPEGAMRKGWFQDWNGKWYYFNTSSNGTKEGAMLKGQWHIGNDNYYFYSDGEMARNREIDGWCYDNNGRGRYMR